MIWIVPTELFNPVTTGTTITLNRSTVTAGYVYRRAAGAGAGQPSFGTLTTGDLPAGAITILGTTGSLSLASASTLTLVGSGITCTLTGTTALPTLTLTAATPTVTAASNLNGLYLNGSTVTLSQTSNETFGSVVITSGTITTFSGTNMTVTNATLSGVANVGTLVFSGTTGSLTAAGALLVPGAATIGGNFTVTGGGTLTTAGAFTIAGSATMSGLDLTSMTAGSVLFAGTGGVVSQNNNHFFWDSANNRLAVGYTAGTTFTKVSPTMTSNTTPSPYVVASSTFFVYPPYGAFGSSRWLSALSTAMPQWISIDMGAATGVSAYVMGSWVGNNVPAKSWIFQGSSDNVNWTNLDTQTGISWSGALQANQYALSGGLVSYRYYRWYITASWAGGNDLVEIWEVQLGTVATTPPTASSRVHVRASNVGDILSIFQGMTSQTGNLTEWRAVDDTIMAKVNSTGGATFPALTISGTSSFTGSVTVGTAATITANGTGAHSIGSVTLQGGTITGAVLSISGTSTFTGNINANGTQNKQETFGLKSGANKSCGTVTLVAGTMTVANTRVTASSIIQLTPQIAGGTQGIITKGTVAAGTSFDIVSSSLLDTSTIGWQITEPY